MQKVSNFDLQIAHKYFAAECFNAAWELIDKPQRTPEEDEAMIRLTHASLWHWSKREDCTPRTLSIGYWQAARVYALLGQADNLGYAYEALTEWVAGSSDNVKAYLLEAQKLTAEVGDPEDRELLEKDLASIQAALNQTEQAL